MAETAEVAKRLYDFIPDPCWFTEKNMAAALGVPLRLLRYAKKYLEEQGRIVIQESLNGNRANPIHTLHKVNPIKPGVDARGSVCGIDWGVFNDLGVGGVNGLSIIEQVELYQELGLKVVPLHFPKFRRGTISCSCRHGRNCGRVGKHPATAWKSLDFTDRRTTLAMRDY